MTSTEEWTPSPPRHYSWPPFTAGHTKSLRHGIWSKRTWEPLAEDLATGLLEDQPPLAAYPELVAAWARAEARCILLAEYLVGRFVDGDESAEKVLRFVGQFEKLAHDLRRELGLTPGSEADLVRSRADAVRGQFDLDAVLARGREARLEAEKRLGLGEAEPDSAGTRAVGDAGDRADGGEGAPTALPAPTPVES